MAKTLVTKEEAEAQARAAHQRLNAIRDAERIEENKSLVGKTFRYRNNYSVPKKPSDYWWLYAKVQKIDKHGYLSVFTFQTDKYGDRQIKTDRFMMSMTSGYQPCSASMFDKAWRDFQKAIATTKP